MGRKKSYNYIGKKEKEPTFYYHSDHLGSASYLTDNYGKVTQTLNYLPYGEDWVDLQNFNVMPASYNLGVYKFNGKEKDAETGYNYYGARYYDSEKISWISVDPMSDERPSLTGYNYCQNNPIILIDPDGNLDGKYVDYDGNTLGYDGNFDNKVHILYDNSYKRKIRSNEKKGKDTPIDNSKIIVTITTNDLKEAVDVLERTKENGGDWEECSVINAIGIVTRGKRGEPATENQKASTNFPPIEGDTYTSIHSHPLNTNKNGKIGVSYSNSDADGKAFTSFRLNIIVGNAYNDQHGVSFYGKGDGTARQKPLLTLPIEAIKKMTIGLGSTVRIP